MLLLSILLAHTLKTNGPLTVNSSTSMSITPPFFFSSTNSFFLFFFRNNDNSSLITLNNGNWIEKKAELKRQYNRPKVKSKQNGAVKWMHLKERWWSKQCEVVFCKWYVWNGIHAHTLIYPVLFVCRAFYFNIRSDPRICFPSFIVYQ